MRHHFWKLINCVYIPKVEDEKIRDMLFKTTCFAMVTRPSKPTVTHVGALSINAGTIVTEISIQTLVNI